MTVGRRFTPGPVSGAGNIVPIVDKIRTKVAEGLADSLPPGEEVKAVFRGMANAAEIAGKKTTAVEAGKALGLDLPLGKTSTGIVLTNQRVLFVTLGGFTGNTFKELRGSVPLTDVTGVEGSTVAVAGFVTVRAGDTKLKYQGQAGQAKAMAEAYTAL